MRSSLHSSVFLISLLLSALLLSGCTTLDRGASTPPSTTAVSQAVSELRDEAAKLSPVANSAAAKEFLRGASVLPSQKSREMYVRERSFVSPAQFASMSGEQKTGYVARTMDDKFYYATHYGSPLAYVRAIDVAGSAGLRTLNGTRILDIGYGAIGGPRMLASAGARVSAVDVDPMLPALYREESDQGSVIGFDGRVGALRLFDGVYVGSTTLTKLIGGEFDLIVSKNTMKRGFMKAPTGRKPFVDFQATDEVLLETISEALAPGGLFLIYNISGAFDAARPSTDGASPFTREQFERAGFEVLALDRSDDPAMRAMGKALGWDSANTPIDKHFFSLYTLARKKPR